MWVKSRNSLFSRSFLAAVEIVSPISSRRATLSYRAIIRSPTSASWERDQSRSRDDLKDMRRAAHEGFRDPINRRARDVTYVFGGFEGAKVALGWSVSLQGLEVISLVISSGSFLVSEPCRISCIGSYVIIIQFYARIQHRYTNKSIDSTISHNEWPVRFLVGGEKTERVTRFTLFFWVKYRVVKYISLMKTTSFSKCYSTEGDEVCSMLWCILAWLSKRGEIASTTTAAAPRSKPYPPN